MKYLIKPRKLADLEGLDCLNYLKLPNIDIKFVETQKYVDLEKNTLKDLEEYQHWHTHIPIEGLELSGRIVKGFNRGSKQLGVPTANIEMSEVNKKLTLNVVPGVYSAMGEFINPTNDKLSNPKLYQCALSIGWNPVYDNPEKTIEVYLLHKFEDDFYDETLKN